MQNKPFDKRYQEAECKKCGATHGWLLCYNQPTDRLIVACGTCGYHYDMDPKMKETKRVKESGE